MTPARKRAARMRRAIESGESFRAIAKRFGVKSDAVAAARARWGLQARYSFRDATRDAFIREQLMSGETLQKVGEALGITRERVRQIANLIGIDIKARRSAARQVRATQTEARKVYRTCGGCGAVMHLTPGHAHRLHCSRECFSREVRERATCPQGHILAAWNRGPKTPMWCRACSSISANPNRVTDIVSKYHAQLALHNAGWLVEVAVANRINATTANKSVTATQGMGSPWKVRDGAGRHLGYASTAAEMLELAEHAWQDLGNMMHASTVAAFASNGHPKSDESFA